MAGEKTEQFLGRLREIALAQLRLAQYTVGDDGWITDFDLKGLLKPLFEIWDKDGSGEIRRPPLCPPP